MSWNEPDSTWQTALRRRVRRIRLLGITVIGLYLLLSIVPFILIGDIRELVPAGLDEEFQWLEIGMKLMFILLLVMPVVMTVMFIRAVRSERRVGTLVPELNGRVCPRCRLPLREAGSLVQCPKCRFRVTPAFVREFWEQYPHQVGTSSFNRKIVEQFARQPGRAGRSARVMKWILDHPILYWCGAALLILIYLAISTRLSGAPFMRSVVSTFVMMIPMFGIYLCLPLTKRRVGESLHCVNCEYERAAGDVGPSCPECGTTWRGSGATVRGRLVKPKVRRLIGAGIILLSIGSYVSSILTGRSFLTAATPTAFYVRQASEADWPSHDAWRELARRRLTADQERRLFETLIDERRRGEPIVGPPDRWMQAALASASTPRELIDAFNEAAIDARIIPPTDVRRGRYDELVAEFTALDRNFQPGGCAFVLVEGAEIGETELFTMPGRTAIRMLRGNPALDDDGRYHFRPRFTPGNARETTARVFYWHLVGPFKLGAHEFLWNDDGTPVLPPSVTWSRRKVIETPLTITDDQ